MNDTLIPDIPSAYTDIEAKTKAIGFSMSSDLQLGSILKTLVASKPQGLFLELGTGTGLSLAWIVEGMDSKARVISVDNDAELIKVAQDAFCDDERVQLICQDGTQWIKEYQGEAFDLIFADTWPGKYSELDETLNLLKSGGLYIIDDMLEQTNWPAGHTEKAAALIKDLEQRPHLHITKMNWSSGLIIATKV
ncbi:class I SAM-dependent methyltransferase [Porifericola rhodea]|uniref:O-methyltransferase n=1 Tax=Porifericola rhodea TaxID=930972 RepID=UPI002665EBFD|nr:class I SAM-dependent methyltransferase [Porifericola rhodea]WKN31122.1 class I SAM-dependent methyltransferase [Porifericola rhodea]